MKILEISKKFQGNFIEHNNECLHIHPNPRPEIYENFRNFSESSEIIASSDIWAWVYMYMIIVLIDYFLKFFRLRIPGVWVDM